MLRLCGWLAKDCLRFIILSCSRPLCHAEPHQAPHMTIHNDGGPQAYGPQETGRTQSAPPTTGTTPSGGRGTVGAEGDSVQISGISAQLADSNAVDGRQRADRVAELAAIYGRGQYQ